MRINKIINTKTIVYLAVGATAFAIDFATFFLITKLDVVPLYVANTSALIAGLIASFIGNRYLTFRGAAKRSRGIYQQFAMYLVLVTLNSFITYGIILTSLSLGAPQEMGKVVSMFLIIIWNFVVYDRLIFRTAQN